MTEHLDLVVVGIFLAVIGAITSGFGMNLMKASNRLERHRPWHRRYRLLVGILLAMGVNTMLDVVAFALTPLALIAPIGGMTIVASVTFARMGWAGQREFVQWQQWAAIFCVVSGVGVVATCGPHPEPVLDTGLVLHHFHDAPFLLYQTVAWSAVALTYAGLLYGKIGQPVLETTLATAATAGLCSGLTQTMMKVMAVCATDWLLESAAPFLIPEFWLAVVELAIVACILLHLLTLTLASAPLTLSTPLYQVSVIIFTIVASCSFFGDLELATKYELFLFMLGVAMVIAGLAVLIAWRESSRDQRLLPGSEPSSASAPAPAPPTVTAEIVEPELVDHEL